MVPLEDSGDSCRDSTSLFIPPRLGLSTALLRNPSPLYPLQNSWRWHGISNPLEPPRRDFQNGETPFPHRTLLVGTVGSGKTTFLDNFHLCGLPWICDSEKSSPHRLALDRDALHPIETLNIPSAEDTWLLIDPPDLDGATTTWISSLVERYPRHRYLVTARADSHHPLPDFHLLRILPWSARMIEQWIAARDQRTPSFPRSRLIGMIEFCGEHTDFLLTPLLLALLADMAQRGISFPRSFAELHDFYIRLLLDRSRRSGGISALLETDLKLRLLAALAGKMGALDRESLEPDETRAILAGCLKDAGLHSDIADDFLREVGFCSGLVQYSDTHEITFLYPDIRRYLQAREDLHGTDKRQSPTRQSAEGPTIRTTLFHAALASDFIPRLPHLQITDDLFRRHLCTTARYIGVGRNVPIGLQTQIRTRLLRQFWQAPYELLQQQALAALCWIADRHLLAHFQEALTNKVPFIRVRAAEALSHLRSPESGAALCRALEDKSWKVRRQATEGLGRIGDPSHWNTVARRCRDPHWQVRIAAAEALGWLGIPEAVPILHQSLLEGYPSSQYHTSALLTRLNLHREAEFPQKAAEDQDLFTRVRLAEAIWRIGDNSSRQLLFDPLDDENQEAQLAIASVLAKEGFPAAQRALTSGCNATAPLTRYRAALGAAHIPPVCSINYPLDERQVMAPLIPHLTSLLEDDSWQVKGVAAVAIGSFGCPEWAEPIIPLLEDGNHFVATNAAVGLNLAQCRKAEKMLLSVLKNSDRPETARAFSARSLGALGISTARNTLLKALSGEGILLRMKAAQALGDIGDRKDMEQLLRQAVVDEELTVRNAAFAAVHRICQREKIILDQDFLQKQPQRRRRVIADAVSLLERYI
jgi:HEAT repeat protein